MTASTGDGVHVGLMADLKEQAFFKAAFAAGRIEHGNPATVIEHGKLYFGRIVRDLDGNMIDASSWDMDHAKKPGKA